MTVAFRPLGGDDVEHVKWALYEAVSWAPDRVLPPYELTIEHPELARYHRDWGRAGDLGVVAEREEEVVGVAFARCSPKATTGTATSTTRLPSSRLRSSLGSAVVASERGS